MSYLPDRLPTGDHSNRQLAGLVKAQQHGELEVAAHAIASRILVEMDRIDSQAAADASRSAFGEEVMFLKMGAALVDNPVEAEALMERFAALKAINTQRLFRRFGS